MSDRPRALPARTRSKLRSTRPRLATALIVLAVLAALGVAAQSAWAADLPPISAFDLCFGHLRPHMLYADRAKDPTPAHEYAAALAVGADYFATTDHQYMLEGWEWTDTLAIADVATTAGLVGATCRGAPASPCLAAAAPGR